MKTLKEILDNYKDYGVSFQDRFGTRLCNFLTKEQGEALGFTCDNEWPEPIEFTRENILKQLKRDVAFGFDKALSQRGISSGLMYEVVFNWNKILEEGLENWNKDNYSMYGLPLFKATAVKYGFDNPIGDDNGDEPYYNEDHDGYPIYND